MAWVIAIAVAIQAVALTLQVWLVRRYRRQWDLRSGLDQFGYVPRPSGLVHALDGSPRADTPITNPRTEARTCPACLMPFVAHIAMAEKRCDDCVRRAFEAAEAEDDAFQRDWADGKVSARETP